MGEEFMGEWRHVYLWLSPFAVHPKLSQHCKPAIIQEKIKKLKQQQKKQSATVFGTPVDPLKK